MAETYAAQLDRVQSLIAQIEASPNQSTTILGRTFTKHDLATLYSRESKLRVLAAREACGGGVVTKQVVPL